MELYRKNHQLMQQKKNYWRLTGHCKKKLKKEKLLKKKYRLLNAQLVENNAHLKAVNEELDRFAYVASMICRNHCERSGVQR